MVATCCHSWRAPRPQTRALACPTAVGRRAAPPHAGARGTARRLGRSRRISTHPDVNHYFRVSPARVMGSSTDEPPDAAAPAAPVRAQDSSAQCDGPRMEHLPHPVAAHAPVDGGGPACGTPSDGADVHVRHGGGYLHHTPSAPPVVVGSVTDGTYAPSPAASTSATRIGVGFRSGGLPSIVGDPHADVSAEVPPAGGLATSAPAHYAGARAVAQYPRVSSDRYIATRRRSRKNPHPRFVPPGSRSVPAADSGVEAYASARATGEPSLRHEQGALLGSAYSVSCDRGRQSPANPPAHPVTRLHSDTTSDECETSPVGRQGAAEDHVRTVVDGDVPICTASGETRLLRGSKSVQGAVAATASEDTSQTGCAQDKYGLSLVSVCADVIWPGAVIVRLPPACSTALSAGTKSGLLNGQTASLQSFPTPVHPGAPQRNEPTTTRRGAEPIAGAAELSLHPPPVDVSKTMTERPTSAVVVSRPQVHSTFVAESTPASPAPLEVKLEPPWPPPRAVKLETTSEVDYHGSGQRNGRRGRDCSGGAAVDGGQRFSPVGVPPPRVPDVQQRRFEASKRPLLQLAQPRPPARSERRGAHASARPGAGSGAAVADTSSSLRDPDGALPRASAGTTRITLHGGGARGEGAPSRGPHAEQTPPDDGQSGARHSE